MSANKLNICLLHTDPFDPNMPARPAITEIYGEYLPSFGHKVTWITPSNERGKEIREEFFKGVRIYIIPRPLASSLPLKIFNLISYRIKEYRSLINVLKEEKYDIIQVRYSTFESLLALYVKNKFKIPFVFQYNFPKGIFKEYKSNKWQFYHGKFENHLTKYILRKADLIFPISKWMKEELVKEGISESKMMPLPMGVNHGLFSTKKDGMEIREEYNLNDAQVIIYIGTMHKIRQPDIIIGAFSKVRKHKDNIKLLMVGEGDDKTNLEELASRFGMKGDIIFIGQVPYFDVPDYIGAADICLSPVPPLPIYKVSSPTKMFEYMAMGKPVVANEEIPEQKEVIEESGGGVLVKFEDRSFADGITELLDNPERAKEMGRKGHEWVVKNRLYENMAREVEKKYFELLETYNKGR